MMSSKPFRFHPEAREEFRDAGRWYRARRVAAAAEFRRTVSDAIRQIAEGPQRWPQYFARNPPLRSSALSVFYHLS
jgi:plasmid stabilization system protein ParE